MWLLLDGEDYDGIPETFSLTPTASEFCFTVDIEDDMILELREYFRANLMADGNLPQDASLGPIMARVNIDDNDGEIRLSVYTHV